MIPASRAEPAGRVPALFAGVTALAAFLLFDVQLLAGRQLLPLWGGAPAVWLTCLLFFQAILLAGYAWAHALARRASPRVQGAAHVALLAVAVAVLVVHRVRWGSPLLPGDGGAGDPAQPVGELLRRLLAGLGAPALALAATAPLLQAWYVRLRPGESPYRLYAWSNFGSLAGLAGFAFILEPLLPLSRQATLWSALFAVEAVALGIVARRAAAAPGRGAGPAPGGAAAPPRRRERLLWLLLPAAGSAALLAFTNQICQEVAVLPLLWVLPLALYLATWMLAFAGPRWRARRLTAPALVAGLALAAVVVYYQLDIPAMPQIAALALALFGVALACHGELARLQPPPRHLTAYYLTGATGGAVGGLFVAALAPRLFAGLWELHVSLVAAALAVLGALAADRALFRDGRVAGALAALAAAGVLAAVLVGAAIAKGGATGAAAGGRERLLVLGGTAAVVLYLLWRLRRRQIAPRFAALLALGLALAIYAGVLRTHAAALAAGSRVALRDFFAAVRVREVAADDPEEHAFWLLHGRIAHGFQYVLPEYRALPTSYYARESGVALAIARHPARRAVPPRPLRVGVLGLGIGTVAAHAAAGDLFRFYEISPSVVRLARGEGGFFSYLRDTRATVEIVSGDARVALERERRDGGSPPYDVLVLDAFASGTVPVHLLTREALRTDIARLAAPDGVLAINVSNRALDLPKLVARLAADAALHGVVVESAASWDGATWHAIWILLARDAAAFDDPEIAARASPLPAPTGDAPLWTDDHSSLLGILRPEAW